MMDSHLFQNSYKLSVEKPQLPRYLNYVVIYFLLNQTWKNNIQICLHYDFKI